jgi:hypothetical protein
MQQDINSVIQFGKRLVSHFWIFAQLRKLKFPHQAQFLKGREQQNAWTVLREHTGKYSLLRHM